MYRAGLESILGFKVRGGRLLIEPSIPRSWPGYELTYRHLSSRYEVTVENPHGVNGGVHGAWLDDQRLAPAASIPLVDDGATHKVRIVLGQEPDQGPTNG
jgi:cyclic beta-1,2-glucan synthetase